MSKVTVKGNVPEETREAIATAVAAHAEANPRIVSAERIPVTIEGPDGPILVHGSYQRMLDKIIFCIIDVAGQVLMQKIREVLGIPPRNTRERIAAKNEKRATLRESKVAKGKAAAGTGDAKEAGRLARNEKDRAARAAKKAEKEAAAAEQAAAKAAKKAAKEAERAAADAAAAKVKAAKKAARK